VALAVLLLAMTAVVSVLGGLLVGSRKASAAADLAALAGAAALQRGEDPCRAATGTVRANQARIRSCQVRGQDVFVRATRDVAVLGRTVRVPGSARAGPEPAGTALARSG
jgi:secretion/DNA translocation related TadE-like protein